MSDMRVGRVNLHGCVMQFLFWFGCCTFISFIVTTLMYFGWTAGAAAMAVTLMGIAVLVTQPFYGYLSDRWGSEKRICVGLFVVAGVCLVLFPVALESGSLVFVIGVMAGFGVSCMQIAGLMDAWIVGLRQENEAVNYGLIRGTGALAFALSAQVSGMVTAEFGHGARFWMGAVFLLAGAFAAVTFRSSRRSAVWRGEGRGQSDVKGFAVLRVIFSSKKYCLLLATAFFLLLSNSPIVTMIQLLIPEFGGTTTEVGTAIALMAVTEVPFMFMTVFLIRKAGFRRLFVLCGAVYFVRLTLTIFVGSVSGLIAVQLLQGLTFAVIVPVSFSYLAKIVEERVRSTAVTVFSALALSLPNILANLFTSAWLSAGHSTQSALVFFAGAAFVGFGLAVYGWVSE